MTLQEKIDKLPLSIPYWDELDYELRIEVTIEEVCVKYVAVEFEFIEVAEEFTLFQVCNQSKAYNLSQRLLDLGLKPETADMKHFFDDRNDYSFFHRWKCFPYEWDKESLVDSENIPAWSLHRLIEILPSEIEHTEWCYSLVFDKDIIQYEVYNIDVFTFGDNPCLYDNIVDCLEWLIKENYINKEYLKQ